MMSLFFYSQATLNRLFNDSIKLYWYYISSSWNMNLFKEEGGTNSTNLYLAPRKSAVLTGFIKASRLV